MIAAHRFAFYLIVATVLIAGPVGELVNDRFYTGIAMGAAVCLMILVACGLEVRETKKAIDEEFQRESDS